jgi:hypothetical protein
MIIYTPRSGKLNYSFAYEKAKAKQKRATWWKYNRKEVIINACIALFIVAACAATHVLTQLFTEVS